MADLYGPIQTRIDTAANWASSNPVLLAGELGVSTVVSDRKGIKVGDGATAWNSLGYANGTFLYKGSTVVQANSNPGVIVAGRTKNAGGAFKVSSGAAGGGGVLFGYAGSDGASTAQIGGPGGSTMWGLAGGYLYGDEGGLVYVYARGPGMAIGGGFARGAGSQVKMHSSYGWAGGYVAHWSDQTGSTVTEIFGIFAGLAFGYAAYGGNIAAQVGAAIGAAYGKGATLYTRNGWVLGYAYTGSDTTVTGKAAKFKAGNAKGAFAGGFATAQVANAVAHVYATASGAFAFGYTAAAANPTSAELTATGKGSTVFGYAKAFEASGTATITATQEGSHAFGKATAGDGAKALIDSTWDGSLAFGYAGGDGSGYGRIRSGGGGSLAFGTAAAVANASAYALISSRAAGSFAFGYAGANGAVTAKIVAYNHGSFAHGYAKQGAYIHAAARGASAFGYAKNASAVIYAAARGSVAMGYATTSEAINVTGIGAVQVAPGTNDNDDSLAVGTNLRLNANGLPGAPLRNGDIWVASNYVYIRTNGVSRKVT